ncbi:hypothetical protein LPMP_140570 [Leishmania panamensis]|uniref:Uncharacterized protein n=7 Tax=Viannia TaxID=37616 RepID=A4H7L5_LEIBR|nr:conserved hypothetical protein [Leishmania braziliensis MHOM/BR/75/M2904]XP_010697291.1 hypothetical protein LPMP_140570 [Leishmania panamensis]KAI5685223.1 hypothetical protein MNV84_01928 [Leishmania braziliensis]CCM13916.1 hypothetical protein, conserved [Leishmania guyanensis]AIN96638.1 hypothetical protein LPMP_140570 [Leishmania panamensis]CAJ2469070.1 unnamed protein product [Leishmania braziliensis]CAJ2469527.1 unnamed protein product [Leishmania braziliensis]
MSLSTSPVQLQLCRTPFVLGVGGKWWKEGPPDYTRANRRRMELEQQRIVSSQHLPPIEPTAEQACQLYRRLLKEGYKTLVVTDKDFYRRKVRYELEVTSRQTSSRVRGIMFEKGRWMLENKLGGII